MLKSLWAGLPRLTTNHVTSCTQIIGIFYSIRTIYCRRPVPLQHFVFPSGAEGLYLVVDEKGKFREDNFQRAMSCLHSPAPELEDKKQKKKSKGSGSGLELFQIVRYSVTSIILHNCAKVNNGERT